MNDPRPEIVLDSRQLRMLAHPLRSRLLSALRMDGPATATRLAEAMATNTGATSYHLRQLAAVGLVVEEPGQGHGRERWWRAAHHSHGWRPDAFASDPDDRAAASWLSEYQVSVMTEMVGGWAREQFDRPPAWRDAAEISDFGLRLTPDRLRALNDELHAVVDRYQAEASDSDDAEQVVVLLAGFPRLGTP
jgi:predicted ArsR family transcriptional regulator